MNISYTSLDDLYETKKGTKKTTNNYDNIICYTHRSSMSILGSCTGKLKKALPAVGGYLS